MNPNITGATFFRTTLVKDKGEWFVLNFVNLLGHDSIISGV